MCKYPEIKDFAAQNTSHHAYIPVHTVLRPVRGISKILNTRLAIFSVTAIVYSCW